MTYSVAIIGAGNLAFHMSQVLSIIPFLEIKYIISREYKDALALANLISAEAIDGLENIPSDVDMVFIWTNDDQIFEVSTTLAKKLPSETLIFHSSGLKTLKNFDPFFLNTGILWPIQSFSKSDTNIKIKKIPFCIIGSNTSTLSVLQNIANGISSDVKVVNEHQKSILHLTAVLSNNFTNHLFHISKLLLEENDLDFNLLLPIIEQTIAKIKLLDPSQTQTGPAIRNDKKTMKQHLDLIQSNDLQKIYKLLSKSILKLNKQ